MALINPNSKKFKNGMAKLYGFGAAIVILGALFKLMDWPGAGAMLTMICSAMLPEASHLSDNNLVGLSTLGGFICSILFKLLE